MKIASGLRSTRSWITSGVRPGVTSRRVTKVSSSTTRPLTEAAKLALVIQEKITLSLRTLPLLGSTLVRPKIFCRAATVAGSGLWWPWPWSSPSSLPARATVQSRETEARVASQIRALIMLVLLDAGHPDDGGTSHRSGSRPLPARWARGYALARSPIKGGRVVDTSHDSAYRTRRPNFVDGATRLLKPG